MFNVETSKYVNSSVIKEAAYGWLEEAADDGAQYKPGICVELNSGARYFYPATREEFDTLTSPAQSAGRYYNVFLKGRDGACYVDDDEVVDAPEVLLGVAAKIDPAPSVEQAVFDNGDLKYEGKFEGTTDHNVELKVESAEQLVTLMQLLYDNDLETTIVRVTYAR